jgi:hypothetical protein
MRYFRSMGDTEHTQCPAGPDCHVCRAQRHKQRRDRLLASSSAWLSANGLPTSLAKYLANFVEEQSVDPSR